MRRLMRLTTAGVLALVALSGCATLQENYPACMAVAGLAGAIPLAVGAAVGCHNLETPVRNQPNNPNDLSRSVPNGHIAAAAAAGAVAGGLIGLGIGHFVCPQEEAAPPPPPPLPPPPPPP